MEDRIGEQLTNAGIVVQYEKAKIKYKIPATEHTYTPDFILPNGIIVESKGVFDSDDRKKHRYIKAQYPHLEIRFVFSNPNQRLYKGSPTTYAMWCTKYGYKYAKGYIPDEWLRDKKKYSLEGVVLK